MMKTMKYMTMAVLALAGAMTAGCSQDDSFFVDDQQTVNNSKTATLTATVGLDADGAETRALTEYGVKTFAVGDRVAVIYTDTDNKTVKAVSEPLTTADIISGGKSARFSVTVTNPDKSRNVTYIYPASMATDEGELNYDALKTQDGTLEYIAANLDACKYEGAWDGDNLPTNVTLANQFAICKFTFMSEDADITKSLTSLYIEPKWNGNYYVRPSSLDVIYVAVNKTNSTGKISFYAYDGTTYYNKKATSSKPFAAGSIYPIKVSGMSKWDGNLSTLKRDIIVFDGMSLTGTCDERKISIAPGATVTLNGVNISNSEDPCITCLDGATIVLSGENTLTGSGVAGIYVKKNNTMTIRGDGSLNAQSTGTGAPGIGGRYSFGNIVIAGGTITTQGGKYAAGIGSGYVKNDKYSSGNITITGGNVTATGGYGGAGIGTGLAYCTSAKEVTHNECGNILITGGTVTATGGKNAAGIGTGYARSKNYSMPGTHSDCKDIIITTGVTRVTATGGALGKNLIDDDDKEDDDEEVIVYANSIGKGGSIRRGITKCGTITIGGTNYGADGITTSPFIYQP